MVALTLTKPLRIRDDMPLREFGQKLDVLSLVVD